MTRTSRSSSLAAVLAVCALFLSACGGGDDEKASKSISDNLVSAQGSGGTSDVVKVKRKDADCIGDGFVDEIGVDKLKKYGLLDKNLKARNDITQAEMSAKDAKSATDVLFGCTDVQGLVKKALGSTGNISPTIKACIDKSLTDKNLRAFMTSTFQGRTAEAQKALTGPLQQCATG